jgi:GxxExxY protein
MVIELKKHNFKVEPEKPIKVYYDNQIVGDFSVDLFIENTIVVELKSVQNIVKEHDA